MEAIKYIRQRGAGHHTKHPLFTTWRMMNVRCYDERHKAFHRYGGRGISVCEEWRWDNPYGFLNFISDVKERPEGTSLDRIDPNGIYCKENCRWATKRVQQNNIDVFDGVTIKGGRAYVSISINSAPYTIGIFSIKEIDKARERYLQIKEMKFTHTDDEIVEFVKGLDDRTPKDRRQYGRKTSKYYGVSWCKERSKWKAAVHVKDSTRKFRQKWLGYHSSEEDAWEAVQKFLGESGEV